MKIDIKPGYYDTQSARQIQYPGDWDRLESATEFQQAYHYERPVAFHGWNWSTTFQRWGALVTFADGWHGFTYPKI